MTILKFLQKNFLKVNFRAKFKVKVKALKFLIVILKTYRTIVQKATQIKFFQKKIKNVFVIKNSMKIQKIKKNVKNKKEEKKEKKERKKRKKNNKSNKVFKISF